MTTQQTIIPQIIIDTAKKAVKSLDVTKSVYYIILPDGTVFDNSNGAIKAAKVKPVRNKRVFKLPYGTITKAFKPQLEAMQVGDVVCMVRTPEMVAAGVTLNDIQGTMASQASKMWGQDSHKSHINPDKDWLEVFRTA
jgi:hypothetical protein